MMPIDGWDLLDADAIQNPEFELGGVQWRIKKLLPFEAKKVLYRFVFPMFNSCKDMDMKGLTPPAVMFRVLTNSDPDILDRLSEVFMRHCIYFRNDTGQYVKLITDHENATKSLLPIELMVLDVRAFAVNFGESVFKLEEEMAKRGMEADDQMDQSEPTPSSMPASPQDTTQSPTSNRGRKKATQK